uniref:Uncharacterized protein n=1 Tax=Anguilla anguilla TaxID=7936 RepID=A0A0E9R315_ANGAN
MSFFLTAHCSGRGQNTVDSSSYQAQ